MGPLVFICLMFLPYIAGLILPSRMWLLCYAFLILGFSLLLGQMEWPQAPETRKFAGDLVHNFLKMAVVSGFSGVAVKLLFVELIIQRGKALIMVMGLPVGLVVGIFLYRQLFITATSLPAAGT